jgi:hypothetical protein
MQKQERKQHGQQAVPPQLLHGQQQHAHSSASHSTAFWQDGSVTELLAVPEWCMGLHSYARMGWLLRTTIHRTSHSLSLSMCCTSQSGCRSSRRAGVVAGEHSHVDKDGAQPAANHPQPIARGGKRTLASNISGSTTLSHIPTNMMCRHAGLYPRLNLKACRLQLNNSS